MNIHPSVHLIPSTPHSSCLCVDLWLMCPLVRAEYRSCSLLLGWSLSFFPLGLFYRTKCSTLGTQRLVIIIAFVELFLQSFLVFGLLCLINFFVSELPLLGISTASPDCFKSPFSVHLNTFLSVRWISRQQYVIVLYFFILLPGLLLLIGEFSLFTFKFMIDGVRRC